MDARERRRRRRKFGERGGARRSEALELVGFARCGRGRLVEARSDLCF
jgi:hypothetical protein